MASDEKVLTVRLAVRAYTPSEFLEILSAGYPRALLQKPHNYRFGRFFNAVNRVIIGPCSLGYGPIDGRIVETIGKMFLGKKPTGMMLLLSDCCGPYRGHSEMDIKRAFPDVTWLVPETGDYTGHAMSDVIARDLEAAEIIREFAD